MEFGQILMIIGILVLIDSLVFLFLTKWILKLRKKGKSKREIKKVRWIEFLIAVVLFLIGMNI